MIYFQLTSRRVPPSVSRKVNVKKLFSDEDSEEVPTPTSPRRPNILHSSSFDDPLQIASNLSTKTRYENDISNIDDYQAEEQQRRLTRQNQIKKSDIAQQSKRISSRKKSPNSVNDETQFDSSEYISNKKIFVKRLKSDDLEKSDLHQPRQPKKERSLTSQSDEVKFLKKN